MIIIFTILSLFGLLSYYIIFSRIKISSFDLKKSSFSEPVSVIICAKNEFENLNRFFPFWINQNYKDFELIIVNDESYDGTYDFLSKKQTLHKNLKIIHVDKKKEQDKNLLKLKGKRYALKKGIEASRNDYILLTDADCKPKSEYWIKEMTKGFSNKTTEIILGYSPYKKEKTLLNKLIQLETTLTAFHYLGFANLKMPYMGVGRNIAYKKHIITNKTIKNSNKSIGGDDDLVVQQLANNTNTEYIISKNSIVETIGAKTFKEWFLQKKRHLGTGVYYPLKFKILLNLFPLLNIFFICGLAFGFPENKILFSFLTSIYFLLIYLSINKNKVINN